MAESGGQAKPAESLAASLQDRVGELQKVRAEHDALLTHILADGGMAVETRKVLLTHLRDEEQEHIDGIDALVGGGGAKKAPAPAGTAAASPYDRGLTVGSLRDESGPARTTARGTVGSLRND